MAETALSVVDLRVVLRRNGHDNVVLDGIDIQAMPGEIVAVVGESGSGKSTLGAAIQGLLPRSGEPGITGSVCLTGVEIVGAKAPILRAARHSLVRAIPQNATGSLNPTMTVRRQLLESVDEGESFARDWLRQVGFPDADAILGAFPHQLSAGQCQRILIAMALMARPRVLIADEPTSALDLDLQTRILDLLRQTAREQGTAILFITHDLTVAASLADRLLVLYRGRVLEAGRVGDVLVNPGHPYSAGLLATRFNLETDRRRALATLPADRATVVVSRNACGYASRCPAVEEICLARQPELRSASRTGHSVACFFPGLAQSALQQRRSAEVWSTTIARPSVLALRMTGVRKSFNGAFDLLAGQRRSRQVLRSVDLSVELGECVALVGESGSGKSTILKLAAGLLSPDGGQVFRIDNAPQFVFQDAHGSLTPWLSIGEQIGDRLRHFGLGKAERMRRAGHALETAGLDGALVSALPNALSIGQCQRAVLARAIIQPPKLLLCDEPISALDVSLAAMTLNLIGELRRRLGMAVLFVTHDLAAARIIADRIAVLREGMVAIDGDPDIVAAGFNASSPNAMIMSGGATHSRPGDSQHAGS